MCYDLFQGRPGGDVIWKGVVENEDEARARLQILSAQFGGAHFAMEISSNKMLFAETPLASRASAG